MNLSGCPHFAIKIVQAGGGAYAGFDENGIFGQAKVGGEALTICGPAHLVPPEGYNYNDALPAPKAAPHVVPEAAQVARMDKIFRTVECREATYVVHKGDSYESIAKKLVATYFDQPVPQT